MMPSNLGPNSRVHDPAQTGMLLGGVCVGAALLLIFLWYAAHRQIAMAVLAVQGVELDILGLFTHQFDWLHTWQRRANPEDVSAWKLWALCGFTGSWLRWPVLLVILGLAGLCMTRAPREMFRQRFGIDGMQSLMVRMHPLGAAWPGTALPLVDPAAAAEPLRPMDPALRRGEWIARYVGDAAGREAEGRARDALRRQLGNPWQGIDSLSDVEACLFLAFSLFLHRKKEEAQAILDSIPLALATRRPRGAPAEALRLPARFHRDLQRKYRDADVTEALKIADRHAWTRPILMTLLQESRLRCGVVNAGLFAAVQLVDRELWLVLSAVSYPRHGLPFYVMSTTSCLEASAAIEHWATECARGMPIPEPQILSTLQALDLR